MKITLKEQTALQVAITFIKSKIDGETLVTGQLQSLLDKITTHRKKEQK